MGASRSCASLRLLWSRQRRARLVDTGHANTEADKAEYIERIRGLPFVVGSVDYSGKQFIDVRMVNNQVIIRVDIRHCFYREIREPLRQLAESSAGSVSGEDAVRAARRAVEGLTLMSVAHGKALSMQEKPDEYDDLTSY